MFAMNLDLESTLPAEGWVLKGEGDAHAVFQLAGAQSSKVGLHIGLVTRTQANPGLSQPVKIAGLEGP